MAAGPRQVLGEMQERVGRMQKDLAMNKHAIGHAPAFAAPHALSVAEMGELERLHSEAQAALRALEGRLEEKRADMPTGTAEELIEAAEEEDKVAAP